MTGPDHRCDRFLTRPWGSLADREWPDFAPLREADRRIDGLKCGMFARCRTVLFADAGHPWLVVDPSSAIAPARERPRLRKRVSRVIHIAELAKAGGGRGQGGISVPPPASLAKLAHEIIPELCARGRVSADISQSELLQPP